MYYTSQLHSFKDEMRPFVKKQNPDMESKDIENKLIVMWNVLTKEEKISYYVKAAAYNESYNVFCSEKKPALVRDGCSEIRDKLESMWRSLTKEESKSYIDKATMSLTPEQVMKRMPGISIWPCDIFCEEKSGARKRGSEIYDKFCDVWRLLTEEEQKPYEEKAKAKIREQYKQREQLVLNAINNAKANVINKQELKNELFDHMEKIKQKEQELLIREKDINTREKDLILKEKQFNEREEELNKKEARLIKIEEYLNNLFLL